MEQMVANASQFSEDSTEAETQPVDTNRLYLDAVGVDTKKRRVYGLGSLASLSYPDSLRSSGRSTYGSIFEQRVQERVNIEMQTIQQRLDEEQQKRIEELQQQVQEEQNKRIEEMQDLRQQMAEMKSYFRMMRGSQNSSSGPSMPPEQTDKDA